MGKRIIINFVWREVLFKSTSDGKWKKPSLLQILATWQKQRVNLVRVRCICSFRPTNIGLNGLELAMPGQLSQNDPRRLSKFSFLHTKRLCYYLSYTYFQTSSSLSPFLLDFIGEPSQDHHLLTYSWSNNLNVKKRR